MPTWISKSYTVQDFGGSPTETDKVEIFRDRVMGWQIDIAKEMIRQIETTTRPDVMNHAGYAVLSVLTSYFEMYWQYKTGIASDRHSAEYFAYGFDELNPGFPMTHEEMKRKAYRWLRCGMYHDGFTKRNVTISSEYTKPCDYDPASIEMKVNPHMMVTIIETHFSGYLATLQPGSVALQNFLRIFDDFMPIPASRPLVAASPLATPTSVTSSSPPSIASSFTPPGGGSVSGIKPPGMP